MENQTIEITLEEYKQLREMCEKFMKLEGEYKYLYHIYKENLKIIEEYEKYLFDSPEKEEETKKNPIGFNRWLKLKEREMKKRSLNERLIYLERDIVRYKNKPIKKLFLIWKKKKLEKKWEKEFLKGVNI